MFGQDGGVEIDYLCCKCLIFRGFYHNFEEWGLFLI